MVVVLITGSRNYKNERKIGKEILKLINEFGLEIVIRHGGALGTDNLAESICRKFNIKTEIIEPNYDDDIYSAPLERNIKMLEKEPIPILVLAFYNKIKKGGTLHTATEARKKNIKVKEFGLKAGKELNRFV